MKRARYDLVNVKCLNLNEMLDLKRDGDVGSIRNYPGILPSLILALLISRHLLLSTWSILIEVHLILETRETFGKRLRRRR